MENLSQIFQSDQYPELASNKALKDKDLLVEPKTLSADRSHPIEHDEVTFSIGADTGLIVQLFNDQDDKDDEKLINVDKELVSIDYDSLAFLKYSLFVHPKVKGSASLKDIGFELDTDQVIESGLYSLHDNTADIRSSVVRDLTSFKTVFKWEDIENLEDKNVLYLTTRGKLSAKVSVSWSDVISKSLNTIGSLLNLPEGITLDIDLTPSLSASYSLSVEDDFLYAICRNDERYEVKLTKAISTDQTAKLKASIGAGFSDPDAVEEVLGQLLGEVIESATGCAQDKIEELIEKAIDGITNEGENELISEIIERLDLEEKANPGEALKEYIDQLEEKAKEIIGEVAKASVKLSFSYEYQRLSSQKELLRASFSKTTLERYHNKFLKFKLGDFVDDYSVYTEDDVNVLSYINEKKVTVKQSWGFGFSLGKKALFSGKDYVNNNEVVRKNIEGKQQVALDTIRGYKSELGVQERWQGNLAAEMPSFSKTETPTMREFQYSLALQLQTIRDIRQESHLMYFLDLGVLWGAIEANEVDRLFLKYYGLLKGQQDVSLEAKMILSDTVFQAFIHQIGSNGLNNTNRELLSASLAGAMDYHEDFAELSTVPNRVRAYAPIWMYFLNHPKKKRKVFRNGAIDHIKKEFGIGNRAELLEESNGISPLLKMNPNTFGDLTAFVLGMSDLSKGIKNNTHYQGEIEDSMQSMRRFLQQSHYVRTLGAFFKAYLELNPYLKERAELILTITYGEGTDEKMISIG